MRITKYLLLVVGLIGLCIFFYFKEAIILGNCAGSPLDCRKLGLYADYLWPLWDFSRAVLVVGILAFFRPQNIKVLLGWTVVSAIGITLAVITAPSISSDFLFPIEKKTVGTLVSGLYLGVSVIIFLVMLWRTRKSTTEVKPS